MRAIHSKVKLIINPTWHKNSKWFSEVLPHIRNIPGLITHRFHEGLELLLNASVDYFGEFLSHIRSTPGLIGYYFVKPFYNYKTIEINDYRDMEVDFEDYLTP